LWILFPQLAFLLELLLQRRSRIGLHRHITFLTELADDMNGPSYPVDIALGSDAADLIQTATGPRREADEALEARVKRFQQ
jgi:hypothetical protein